MNVPGGDFDRASLTDRSSGESSSLAVFLGKVLLVLAVFLAKFVSVIGLAKTIGLVAAAIFTAPVWRVIVRSVQSAGHLRQVAGHLRPQVNASAGENVCFTDELDRFGKGILKLLPPRCRRYFHPYLQDKKCEITAETADYKGPDREVFNRRR